MEYHININADFMYVDYETPNDIRHERDYPKSFTPYLDTKFGDMIQPIRQMILEWLVMDELIAEVQDINFNIDYKEKQI